MKTADDFATSEVQRAAIALQNDLVKNLVTVGSTLQAPCSARLLEEAVLVRHIGYLCVRLGPKSVIWLLERLLVMLRPQPKPCAGKVH